MVLNVSVIFGHKPGMVGRELEALVGNAGEVQDCSIVVGTDRGFVCHRACLIVLAKVLRSFL